MNATIAPTPAAPSAAPVPAAPAAPAATMPAAPSAPDRDPSNLAYYDRVASEALMQGSQPAVPAAPAHAPGNGSPPVAAADAAPVSAEPPTAPAPVAPAAVQTSEPPAPPAADDEPEPTPEEQATWTEGERRLHKALVKEREKNKDSRRQLNEFKEKLDKLAPPTPPDPNAPPTPPAQPPRPPRALEECNTPEAVESLTVEAISMEGKMTRLSAALQRNNTAGVIQFLKAEGKQKIGETPIEEATPEQLSEYVTSVQEGARMVQAQAEPRKRFLNHQAAAWSAATKMIPELSDPRNARAQKFVAIVQQNPWLRQQGPNWPIIAAKYLIGDERTNAPATPAAATAPVVIPQPAAPVATARPAPAAPRTAPVAPAQGSELDGLRRKMTDGSATEADIDRYAVLAINAPATAQA